MTDSNIKLFNTLKEECPVLYRHDKDDNIYMISFSVGEGWHELVYDLSLRLEKYIREHPDLRDAYSRLVIDAWGNAGSASFKVSSEKDTESYLPFVCQVKEKFGGLRFYISHATDEMHKMIEEAEKESYLICELCGSRDGVTTGGESWIRTLCKNCR